MYPFYRPTLHFALAAVSLVALAGCSTGGQRLTKSGFLADYSRLQADGKHKNTGVWVSPAYDPAPYRDVIVEPVEWYGPRRQPEVEDRLKREFRDLLIKQLSARYRIVDQAGVRTMRIRSAITNVRKTRWYLNAPAQAESFALGGIGLFAPLQGGASEEMQVEDAQTKAVLVQMATYRNGKPWNVKGSYVAYDHARMAFTAAAESVARVLERAPVAPG